MQFRKVGGAQSAALTSDGLTFKFGDVEMQINSLEQPVEQIQFDRFKVAYLVLVMASGLSVAAALFA